MSLKASWPIGLTAFPMGVIAFCLLWTFPEAIEVYDAGYNFSASRRGGPETLFMMNSGVFGWLCVIVAERRVGAGGLCWELFRCDVEDASWFARNGSWSVCDTRLVGNDFIGIPGAE